MRLQLHADPRLWWIAAALMIAALLVPVVAVPVPPLIDYPNHLARAYFLAFGERDPVMRRIFAAHWAIIPNLAIDLLLPPLMRVMPPLIAGRVLVGLALILPVTGAIALSAAIFRRLSPWQLGAGLVAYNTMFLIGTLSFQLAAGLALWGAAGWVALSTRRPLLGAIMGAVVAVVTFLFHLFGFGFFALLIGCFELDAVLRRGLADPAGRRLALRRCLAVGSVGLLPLILYALSPFAAATGPVVWPTPWKKLAHLLIPVNAYFGPLGLLIAAAILAPLLLASLHGRLVTAPMGRLVFPLLLVVYLALPIGAKGGYWIDTRVPVLLGFALFALLQPQGMPRVAVGGLGLILVLQIAFITVVWQRQQADIAQLRAVLRHVAAGARVLVVDGNPGQHRAGLGRTPAHGDGATYWHYGAFAFIDRHAFWSDAFSIPGQQPVMALPPYDVGDGGLKPPRPYTRLADTASRPISAGAYAFMDGWPARYDYVLLLQAQCVTSAANLLPRRLMLVELNQTAALYRIRR